MRISLYQKQLRWAIQHGLQIVGVYEADFRRESLTVDLQEERDAAPVDLRQVVDASEFIELQRFGTGTAKMCSEILNRGGIVNDVGVAFVGEL